MKVLYYIFGFIVGLAMTVVYFLIILLFGLLSIVINLLPVIIPVWLIGYGIIKLLG